MTCGTTISDSRQVGVTRDILGRGPLGPIFFTLLPLSFAMSPSAQLQRALAQIQEKQSIPEIDFTQHHLENGNVGLYHHFSSHQLGSNSFLFSSSVNPRTNRQGCAYTDLYLPSFWVFLMQYLFILLRSSMSHLCVSWRPKTGSITGYAASNRRAILLCRRSHQT